MSACAGPVPESPDSCSSCQQFNFSATAIDTLFTEQKRQNAVGVELADNDNNTSSVNNKNHMNETSNNNNDTNKDNNNSMMMPSAQSSSSVEMISSTSAASAASTAAASAEGRALPPPPVVAPVPSAASSFSSVLQAAHLDNWPAVGSILDAFALQTVSSPALRASQPHRQARHQLIQLCQTEFEAAFASKNLKRRQAALLIVCHIFRAQRMISEKVVVTALYKCLGIESNSNSSSQQQQHHHNTPLWALLAVARALNVASSLFENCGLQYLPAIVSKLCSGMLTSCPNAEQHAELCEAIRINSAVLHGLKQ